MVQNLLFDAFGSKLIFCQPSFSNSRPRIVRIAANRPPGKSITISSELICSDDKCFSLRHGLWCHTPDAKVAIERKDILLDLYCLRKRHVTHADVAPIAIILDIAPVAAEFRDIKLCTFRNTPQQRTVRVCFLTKIYGSITSIHFVCAGRELPHGVEFYVCIL